MIMNGCAESGHDTSGRAVAKERLQRLEVQVEALIEAVRALVHGLKHGKAAEPGSMNAEHAARRAHRVPAPSVSRQRPQAWRRRA